VFHCCSGHGIFCRQAHLYPSVPFLPSFVAHTIFHNSTSNGSNSKKASSFYANWWYYLIFVALLCQLFSLSNIQHSLPSTNVGLQTTYWNRSSRIYAASFVFQTPILIFRCFSCNFLSFVESVVFVLSAIKFRKHVKVLFSSCIPFSALFWYSHVISLGGHSFYLGFRYFHNV